MRKRLDIGGLQRLIAAAGDPILPRLDAAAHGAQLHDGHMQVRRVDAAHRDRAARERTARQEGTGLDAIAHRGVLAGMQAFKRHALHLDDGRAGAADLAAHGVEHVRQIDDLRLTRGVLDAGGAMSGNGGHKAVLRGADAGELQRDIGTVQAVGRVGVQVPVVHGELHTQGLKTHQVHIDLAGTDLAAAGHGHARLAETRHQRAEHADGRAHLRHQLVGRFMGRDLSSVDDHGVAVALDGGAEALEHLRHDDDIADKGHIVQR